MILIDFHNNFNIIRIEVRQEIFVLNGKILSII